MPSVLWVEGRICKLPGVARRRSANEIADCRSLVCRLDGIRLRRELPRGRVGQLRRRARAVGNSPPVQVGVLRGPPVVEALRIGAHFSTGVRNMYRHNTLCFTQSSVGIKNGSVCRELKRYLRICTKDSANGFGSGSGAEAPCKVQLCCDRSKRKGEGCHTYTSRNVGGEG